MINRIMLSVCAVSLLAGCENLKPSAIFPSLDVFKPSLSFMQPSAPKKWTESERALLNTKDVRDLQNWWRHFNDPILNELVNITLHASPDRRIAEARIREARGMQLSNQGSLFPTLGVSGSEGREKTVFGPETDFYNAQFDASFEIDVFGKNTNRALAAQDDLKAAYADYHNTTLTLIADVARTYVSYRGFQKQIRIAENNLDLQTKTLDLLQTQKEFGEATALDVERADNLVNTTRASLPEFERLANNAKLQISVLVGALPEHLEPLFTMDGNIPIPQNEPVLLAPAIVLSLRPDVRAAGSLLDSATHTTEATRASVFPTISISGFYGVVQNALVDSTNIWQFAANAAITLIDFGRIEGQINAAHANEMRAFEQYRKTIYSAITEVEIALNDYSKKYAQYTALDKAFKNADKALELSELLFKEGEISYLNVLDAQRTANTAASSKVTAETEMAEALVRIYKSLGIY